MTISPVNAFTPADEVREPERFAGRKEQLQTLSRALESDGVQIVIYGNRGVGKSSLAHQLSNLVKSRTMCKSDSR
jgi:Cdc6-like AAA superfamily ATPase